MPWLGGAVGSSAAVANRCKNRLAKGGCCCSLTKARLEHIGQLAVAVGHVGSLLGQGVDAVAQGGEALVDELRLLEPLAGGRRLGDTFAAGQVAQPQLGPPGVTCPSKLNPSLLACPNIMLTHMRLLAASRHTAQASYVWYCLMSHLRHEYVSKGPPSAWKHHHKTQSLCVKT